MQMNFKTFEEWGEDSFCIQDYRAETGDNENYFIAAATVFDEDMEYPSQILNFIDMAAEAGSAIIVIELNWLSMTDEAAEYVESIVKQATEIWNYFEFNETYETKLCFCLVDDEVKEAIEQRRKEFYDERR